jgi:uncharacterized RDD family membrane protein YckC
MIRYQGIFICQTCKPVFMQKLAEGAAINTGEFRYGGFWIRVLSQIVDALALMPVSLFLVVVLFGLSLSQAVGVESRSSVAFVAIQFLGFLMGVTYETLMVGTYGATLGKMAIGLRVVGPDGGRISYGRACGRYFAKTFLGPLTLYIGYIIAGFDAEKRTLHDRICNTRVIYK